MDAIQTNDTPRLSYVGELLEGKSGLYLLGDRPFCPCARSFTSPDSLSPFDDGGLNRYTYCASDPINRIDPSGESFWEWLGIAVGIGIAVAAAVASGGTLVAAAGAAGGLGSALLTSSGATAAVAAVLDAGAVAVELASTAAKAKGDQQLAGILGWVGVGLGIASLGTSLALVAKGAGKAATRSSRSALRVRPEVRRRSTIARRSSIDEDHVGAQEVARSGGVRDDAAKGIRSETGSQVEWLKISSNEYPGAVHFGADREVTNLDVLDAVKTIAKMPFPKTTVFYYTGAHGHEFGDNWELGRRALEFDFPHALATDLRNLDELVTSASPHSFVLEDIGVMSVGEARAAFGRPGIHIHSYCYGASDQVLRDMFRAKNVAQIVGHI